MKYKLQRIAMAVAWLGIAVSGAVSAQEVSYTLIQAAPETRPADAPPLIFAATFEPQMAARSAWDDRLTKLHRGGFNAVQVLVPWNFNQPGAMKPIDLEELLGRLGRLGMKAIVSPPVEGPSGDWTQWFSAIRPSLEKQAAHVLWLQANAGAQDEGVALLAQLARENALQIPVVAAQTARVSSGPDEDRPYREPAVGVALRAAVAGGVSALAWHSPFVGVAPPLITGGRGMPPTITNAEVGGLPISYYEAKLFGSVIQALGAPLTAARPVEGAVADVPGVSVAQRNAGAQGFLFVQTPAEPLDRFQITFTDPATNQKLTVPRQPGLRLRTYGAGARILPLNLPLTHGKIRYSTAEVFGIYRLGGRSVVLLTDDEGSLNEIALEMETAEEPEVVGSGAPPLWDPKTRTLTVAVVTSFSDAFVTIGDDIVLGVVSTERAQRTWTVRYQGVELPLITSAYLVGEAGEANGKLVMHMLSQQGRAAVTMLPDRRPRYLAVNGLAPRMSWVENGGALLFRLDAPLLAAMKVKPPVVQVLEEARFQPGSNPASTEYARPDYPAAAWQQVNLDRPRGAGWYRTGFQTPAIREWTVPWKATLHVKGKADVYLNGERLGTLVGAGVEGEFTEIHLPERLLRPGTQENTLAIFVEDGASIHRVGIAPWIEHAVMRHSLVFTM